MVVGHPVIKAPVAAFLAFTAVAVPMGEGFIDYPAFFRALTEVGFDGYVAYEMCSTLRGGGSQENLDRCARQFLAYMASL